MVLGIMVMSSCIKRPPPTDYLPELIESLDLARVHATMARIDAYDMEDETSCEGWSVVERVAPFVSTTVINGTAVLPGARLDLSVCAGSDQHPSTESVRQVVREGLMGPVNLARAWHPVDERGCVQRLVVLAAEDYAAGAVIALTEHGSNDDVWTIQIERLDVDVKPCR